MLRGVDFLANVVKVTEGPRGRNVILGQRALGQTPRISRDGVSVSNYADPSDPTEQIGSDLIREAAQKTDNAVGDGTTASIVIAQALIHSGFDYIKNGANPMAIERGIHKAVDAVIVQLRKTAIEVSDEKVIQVAIVSAHGDAEIGKLVAGAVLTAGKDGVVTAEPSSTADTTVQTVAGIELEKSNLISQAFVTHPEDFKAELHDCKILLWEGVIATAKSVVPLLDQVNKSLPAGGIPLLLVAGGYEAEALACIITNKLKLGLPLIAIRLEAYGARRKELLGDIAALTGGKAYTEDLGLKIESVKLSELGSARKIITDMNKTQIIEGKGNQEELVGRVASIRSQIETGSLAEKPHLTKRLASLLGGITIIKVGGTTVTEMEEKRDRVIDAMSASKSALASGIVPGGGTALLRASVVLSALELDEEEQIGVEVVHDACSAVVKQIAENAGLSRGLMLSQLMATPNLGFNAMTGRFEDLVETGIIDPCNVVCEALKNAAAVACSILTMGAVISECKTEKTNG